MSLQSRRTQLLLVNSLTFGLEVCLAAGITYVPPLLLEVGVEEKFMTMVLGRQLLSPLSAVFFFFYLNLAVWRVGVSYPCDPLNPPKFAKHPFLSYPCWGCL